MSTASEHAEHVAELRREATRFQDDANPRVAYFATWLGFYMDELERARQAHGQTINRWAESIARRRDDA